MFLYDQLIGYNVIIKTSFPNIMERILDSISFGTYSFNYSSKYSNFIINILELIYNI